MSLARHPAGRRVLAAAGAAVLAGLLGAVVPPVPALATAGGELVVNGSFETGTAGWRTNNDGMSLRRTTTARDGRGAAVLSAAAGSTAVLNDVQNTVASTTADTRYVLAAWVRTNLPGLSGQIRVREVAATGVRTFGQSFWLTDRSWQRVELPLTTTTDGASLDVNVLGWNLEDGQRLLVDSVSLAEAAPAAPTSSAPAGRANNVTTNARGVPLTGALLGAAYGSNTDPAPFERQVGQRLGLRRTYWGPDEVDEAVRVAERDLVAGRLPWISFKLPHSWRKMAAGVGDPWVRDLTAKLGRLPGPVWVAFHHEPEAEGPIAHWTAMQEHLGPMVREAPNVGFTVILTGWNQLFGSDKYALDALWPLTEVDVAGFDVYNFYGAPRDGRISKQSTDLRKAYFDPLSRWAKQKGVAWALAETGLTDLAAKRYPYWMEQTYIDVVTRGGVAVAYFNTRQSSTASWVITTPGKRKQYADALRRSPTFPLTVR